MANIKKLEEALELLINEEDAAANAKMHEYYVGLARKINEELQDAELEEADLYDDDDIENDMDEIDQEEGVIEDDDEDFGDEDFGDDDMDMDDDFGDDDMGDDMGDEDIHDEVMDLESRLSDLEAAFNELSDVESDEHDMEFDGETDMEDDFGDDLEGDDMDDDFGDDEFSDDDMDDDMDDDFGDDFDDDEDEFGESRLREYTEKVTLPTNSEGQEVGKAGKNFTPNTTQNLKPQGNLSGGNAKPQMSKGGETRGYPQPKKGNVKDMGNPDNKVKSSKSVQSKVTSPGNKEGHEIGSGGKTRPVDKKQLLKKRGGK